MTNYTVQDGINKGKEVYDEKCRSVLDEINIKGYEEQDDWKSFGIDDMGRMRWYNMWVTSSIADQKRIDCLNISIYPPFAPI